MLSLTVIASAISITGASLSLLSGLNSSCLDSSTLATLTFFLGVIAGSVLAIWVFFKFSNSAFRILSSLRVSSSGVKIFFPKNLR